MPKVIQKVRVGGIATVCLCLAVGAFCQEKPDDAAPPDKPAETLYLQLRSVGLDPASIIYNHLNQPREMVQADVVDGLLA